MKKLIALTLLAFSFNSYAICTTTIATSAAIAGAVASSNREHDSSTYLAVETCKQLESKPEIIKCLNKIKKHQEHENKVGFIWCISILLLIISIGSFFIIREIYLTRRFYYETF